MQFFKHSLNTQLFNLISEHYKTRHFPNGIYDQIRAREYGNTPASYDGAGECGHISNMLQEYLDVHGIKTNRYLKNRWCDYSEKQLSCYDHIFLCTSDEKIIIDATWKQLFFDKKGKIDKWFSKYTEYLYALPPVFVGTPELLRNTLCSLHKIRDSDPLHKEDLWLPDWYEKPENIDGAKPEVLKTPPKFRK